MAVDLAWVRSNFPFHAARADLLRRAGRVAEAVTDYRRALELAPSEPEKRYITRRIRELEV